MKTLKTIILLFAVALIAACNGSTKNSDISGVYVNQAQSEYSVAWDTLIINPVSKTTKTYTVERRDGFQRIRNGVKQPMEYKQEKWDATWNTDKQVLAETELGRQIRISPDTPGVMLKNTLFRKIR